MGETQEKTEPNASGSEKQESQTRENDTILDVDSFRALQTGSHIEVHRTHPSKIAGYLGYIVIPQGGIGDVYEEVQQTYGGGKYQLRAKKLSQGGGLRYAPGAVQIAIGGYPVQGGLHYVNDQWRPIPQPPAAIAPPVGAAFRPNGGESNTDQLFGMMRDFVGQSMQASLRGEPGGVKLNELPQLLTALAALQGPQRERDGFGDLERAFGLIEKLERRREAVPAQPVAPASSEGSGGMDQILQMLAMKFLGQQNQPQQHVSAPPQPPPQPPNYPPYPPNMSGQQMWDHVNQQAPAQGPGWTNPPQHAQAGSGPPATPPQSGGPNQATEAEPVEYEPLTVDEVIEDIATRDKTEQAKFLGELCEKLGLDEKIVNAMFPNGPPNSIPLDGTFPEPPK